MTLTLPQQDMFTETTLLLARMSARRKVVDQDILDRWKSVATPQRMLETVVFDSHGMYGSNERLTMPVLTAMLFFWTWEALMEGLDHLAKQGLDLGSAPVVYSGLPWLIESKSKTPLFTIAHGSLSHMGRATEEVVAQINTIRENHEQGTFLPVELWDTLAARVALHVPSQKPEDGGLPTLANAVSFFLEQGVDPQGCGPLGQVLATATTRSDNPWLRTLFETLMIHLPALQGPTLLCLGGPSPDVPTEPLRAWLESHMTRLALEKTVPAPKKRKTKTSSDKSGKSRL
jgi:hypothetical protein